MPEYIYFRPVRYEVDAAETLREIGEIPHMLLRISIRGGYFPHRNAATFARIHGERKVTNAIYSEIDDDEGGFRAYFPIDIPLMGMLVIGFGDDIVAEIEFDRLKLEPLKLDVRRIESAFHRVTMEDPGVFRIKR